MKMHCQHLIFMGNYCLEIIISILLHRFLLLRHFAVMTQLLNGRMSDLDTSVTHVVQVRLIQDPP